MRNGYSFIPNKGGASSGIMQFFVPNKGRASSGIIQFSLLDKGRVCGGTIYTYLHAYIQHHMPLI